jgi:hypothetical protein
VTMQRLHKRSNGVTGGTRTSRIRTSDLNGEIGATGRVRVASWQTLGFLILLFALGAAGYEAFAWQWRLSLPAAPCTGADCPIPWLGDAVTIGSFGGSLIGAAACFFTKRKFGRWLLASVGLLAALLFACLIEWWVAGGDRHGWH